MRGLLIFFIFFIHLSINAQPGRGNGGGGGNGGGNGGGCGSPPCGGPNQPVPVNGELLVLLGGMFGVWVIYKKKHLFQSKQ